MDINAVDSADYAPSERETARESCPVCGSGRIGFFATVPDNGHLRRDDIELPLHRCSSCDLFFLNPPPPAELGREYFAQAYSQQRGNVYYDENYKTTIAEVRVGFLDGYPTGHRRLLDVGCGKGHFVYAARQRGWDGWGVELDEGACSYASTTLGLATVLCADISTDKLPSAFDVITLWDVIEHVRDPLQCLADCATRLEPLGLIVIRTGNIRSWSFDRNRRRWWAFGVDHRFYFSPASLGVALESAGFQVLDVLNREPFERPNKRRARELVDTGLFEGVGAISRSPAKLLKSWSYVSSLLRRTLGRARYGSHYETSIMTVVARKREKHDYNGPGC